MRRIVAFLLITMVLYAVPAQAATFLKLAPSARSWGMGQAGAAVIDPFVVYFNPGGLGVYALRSPVGFARNSQDWMPTVLDDSDEAVYANTLVLAGFPIPGSQRPGWPRMWAAVAYHRQALDLKMTVPVNPGGTLDVHSRDRSNGFTVAIGLEHGLEIGFGGTLKFMNCLRSICECSPGTTTGRDAGVFVRVPLLHSLLRLGIIDDGVTLGPLVPEIVITSSYAWANRGGDIKIGDDTISLPRLNRFGRTVMVRVTYREAAVLGWLATRDDEISKLNRGEERHEGWEVDLLGIVRLQKGDVPGPDGLETHGMSVHTAGVVQWISALGEDQLESGLPWWITNLDIFYRTAEIEKGSNWLLGGTEFKEFGFTLHTGPLWN